MGTHTWNFIHGASQTPSVGAKRRAWGGYKAVKVEPHRPIVSAGWPSDGSSWAGVSDCQGVMSWDGAHVHTNTSKPKMTSDVRW